ncbi:MAG TPA: biopolymer transporter ExbD [Gemmatimonadaceae bacterium]|nr:biopolymer transporter ExbD [Gemmatimonadaceae bacterium]
MAMSVGDSGSVKAEPNVVPMIDIMLVLLIIFMLVVPSISAGFQAIPPTGQNLKPHPEEDRDQVLGIDADGQYFLNKAPIPNAELGQRLKAIYESREEDKLLYIKAHKDLEYGKVLDALDIASKNEVRVTGMITDQQPGTKSLIATDNIMAGAPASTEPEGKR